MSKIKGITIEKLMVHDPKFDTTFKVLFGESKERTISFLNAVYNFTGDEAIIKVDIEFTNVVDAEIKGLGRSVIFDIKCYDRSGRYFIIEMQKGTFDGYFERAIYYGARQLISAANILWQDNKEQYESDIEEKGREHAINANASASFYKSIPQVRVLSILDYTQFKDCKDYASSYNIARTSDGEIGSEIISWDFIELPKFHTQEPELKTTMDRWLYLLKRRESEVVELTENILGTDSGIASAYRRLASLTKEEQESLERDMKDILDWQAHVKSQLDEGLTEERNKTKQAEQETKQAKLKLEQERKQAKLKLIGIVQNLLSMGMDIPTIEQTTGFSEYEIIKLQSEKK